MKPLTFLALVLALGSSAQAQVTFTFNTTARTTALGYTVGQPYSFQFITGSSFGDNAASNFDANQNYWTEDNTAHDLMYTSVTGSGLGGTFTRPTGAFTDPYSEIETWLDYVVVGSGQDGVFVRADTHAIGGNIGLTTNSGAFLVGSIFIRMDESGTTFHYPEQHQDPVAFFASETGTFTPPAITMIGQTPFNNYRRLEVATVSDGLVQFDIQSWSIAVVPEPSTYAAAAGLLVGAAALVRRRRRA